MSELSPPKPRYGPFVSEGVPSLKDVLDWLEKDDSLPPTRRRDLRSALTSIARLIGRRPEEIPANINRIHILLRRVHPAAHNMSKKRFSNIKSDALKALALTGCSRERADWLRQPSPEWQSLLDRIPIKQDRWRLSQLAQFCSALGILPNEVNDSHVNGLHKMLIEESFSKAPDQVAVYAVKTWNKLRVEIAGWPDIELSRPPRKRTPWTFKLETFPESFQEDVDNWFDRQANPDPLSNTGPFKPIRPVTIKHRRFQIQMMASALVRKGRRREDITSLADLVDLQNFKDGLRYLRSRHNDKSTEAIHTLAVGLKGIARHHVKVNEEHLNEMFQICKRINLEVDGLREKNRMRLLQLEDDHSLARLIHLPAELVRASKRPGNRAHKSALLMQAALAIEVLLYAPMRIGNLAALDLERHIRRIRVGREKRTQIAIPGEEVKNGKPLNYELGPGATKLLDTYIEVARPVLLRKPSDCLFPAQEGGHKGTTALSTLIKSTIREYTGLDITAHLFRSIAVKLHSRMAPGDYVTLSHVLSDTLSTTMKAYAQFEQKSSLEHYQRSVEKGRSQLPLGRKIRKSG